MNPEYPVYVISKGRWESRLTVKALEKRNIPYYIVIEPQELSEYSSVIKRDNILTLPFSNLGQGSIPARNWVWEDAIKRGTKRHWILDDNIRDFYVLNRNIQRRTTSGTSFYICEQFVDRFLNVGIAGMQYKSFAPRKNKQYPFILNTRIYSCILLDNNVPFRWRGRYNEDTDLSLRILKSGLCSILFRMFLADKVNTLKMKGGNTDELYKKDGRYQMAMSLWRQHPDVTRVGKRYNRWQHIVDYRKFKGNKLVMKPGLKLKNQSNNFGMKYIVTK